MMSHLGLKIFGLIASILYVNGCTVGEIDLSFIASEISCTFGETTAFTYQIRYTPCVNDVECTVDGSFQMAMQQETTKATESVKECWLLAMDSDEPVLSSQTFHDENAYVIQYRYGEDDRVTDFRFFCGDTEFDESKTTCGEVTGSNPPEYYLEIYSSTICSIEPPTVPSTQKSGLSAGWIFVIMYVYI